jgi:hypothetical protein
VAFSGQSRWFRVFRGFLSLVRVASGIFGSIQDLLALFGELLADAPAGHGDVGVGHAQLTLTGTYVISGTLKLTNAGEVRTNAGSILLDGSAARILNQADGNALANFSTNQSGANFTLRNSSSLNVTGALSNAGAVTVGPNSTLTVPAGYMQTAGSTTLSGGSLSSGAAVSNAAAVTIGNGSTLSAAGPYTQTAGSTTLNGGTLTARVGAANQTVDIRAGSLLSGSGTITGNLVNAGDVRPGGTGAAGLLTVEGAYTQTATGVLNIEIGGAADNQYDRLSVRDVATLAGTLHVTRINSFMPDTSDLFQVLAAGSRSGEFNFTGLDGGLRGFHEATGVLLVINRAPVLDPIPNQAGTVGTELSLSLIALARDPDGDSLTFLLEEAPAGASLTGGVFRWTPAQAGTFTVRVRVSDNPGGGRPSLSSEVRTLTITVP